MVIQIVLLYINVYSEMPIDGLALEIKRAIVFSTAIVYKVDMHIFVICSFFSRTLSRNFIRQPVNNNSIVIISANVPNHINHKKDKLCYFFKKDQVSGFNNELISLTFVQKP